MVEGVNDYTNNQVTLHTAPGCSMPSSDPTALGISGSLIGGTDCAAADTGNAGCGVRASETNSYGAPFNAMGGGVYASKFSSYIVWHDANRGILQLQRYGTTTGSRPGFSRAARYPQTCRAVRHSPRHGARPWPHSRPRHATRSSTSISTQPSLTPPSGMYPVNTKIRVSDAHVYSSGDWGGGVWDASGVPGQDQSCAARTGVASCSDFVLNNGASFTEACEY